MNDKNAKRVKLEKLLRDINMSSTYSAKILSAFYMCDCTTELYDIGALKAEINLSVCAGNQEKTIMLFLVLITEERENGAWVRYPEDIFIHTVSDFSSFVRFYKEATGEEGYGKGAWPMHYAEARIFRLGEFEFEIISDGTDKRVEIHIPEGADLCPEQLSKSLVLKDEFFKRYLPEWNDIRIECASWMLSPVLKDILSEGSRILWFQSMFDIFDTEPDNNFYLQFVFDLEYIQWCNGYDLAKLPEKTSLQRKLKRFVLNGGKPGIARGWLKEEAL